MEVGEGVSKCLRNTRFIYTLMYMLDYFTYYIRGNVQARALVSRGLSLRVLPSGKMSRPGDLYSKRLLHRKESGGISCLRLVFCFGIACHPVI